MTAHTIFQQCVEAIRQGVLIERESAQTKSSISKIVSRSTHRDRLNFEARRPKFLSRFSNGATTEGYEIKGLLIPAAMLRSIQTVRFLQALIMGEVFTMCLADTRRKPDGNRYPVLDLVICHGAFLNADHEYVHKTST
jgi:hypothetical protein